MKILLVKTSSLGDLLHVLPALSDAKQALPTLHIDWVVEEDLLAIPSWHHAVGRVVPVAMRRWHNQPRQLFAEVSTFIRQLRECAYDQVIDAQGLLKSALLTALASGPGAGYDLRSAREFIAAFFYRYRFAIDRHLHAIARNRQLFAATLNYTLPDSPPDFSIQLPSQNVYSYPDVARQLSSKQPYLVFLHGTKWSTKQWPATHWRELVVLASVAGYQVLLPWGNSIERQRANYIAAPYAQAKVLPLLPLSELAHLLARANGVVALDTGLAHLAVALAVPCVGIYGASDASRTGLSGTSAVNLVADLPCVSCRKRTCSNKDYDPKHIEPPCMYSLQPNYVWHTLQPHLKPQTHP